MQYNLNHQDIFNQFGVLLNIKDERKLANSLMTFIVAVNDLGVFIAFEKTNFYQVGKFLIGSRLIPSSNLSNYPDIYELFAVTFADLRYDHNPIKTVFFRSLRECVEEGLRSQFTTMFRLLGIFFEKPT